MCGHTPANLNSLFVVLTVLQLVWPEIMNHDDRTWEDESEVQAESSGDRNGEATSKYCELSPV